MSILKELPPVKAFAAVFAQDSALIHEAVQALSAYLGAEPDIVSPEFPLKETRYYEPEMGAGLVKVYASWPGLMNPEDLVALKLWAMDFENTRLIDGQRQVNVDPGYIGSGGLVLSTGKFRGHRLPLGRSVWGELTLHYHQGEFQAFPWSYQDYKSPEVQEYLMKMRKALMLSLRESGH